MKWHACVRTSNHIWSISGLRKIYYYYAPCTVFFYVNVHECGFDNRKYMDIVTATTGCTHVVHRTHVNEMLVQCGNIVVFVQQYVAAAQLKHFIYYSRVDETSVN